MNLNRDIVSSEFERLESRVMLAVIEGQIFRDDNENGIHDEGEVGLDGWYVDAHERPRNMFSRPDTARSRSIDKNGDGVIDPVSETGWYSIPTHAGMYQVSPLPRPNWHVVAPVGEIGIVNIDSESSTVKQDFAMGREHVGDFNNDNVINATDIQMMCEAFQDHQFEARFDLNGDSHLNASDFDELIEGTLGSTIGDANLDRRFDSLDLIAVLQQGEYNDEIDGNSTWEDGDWNCDGEFDPFDLISAFLSSNYMPVNAVDFATPQANKIIVDLKQVSDRTEATSVSDDLAEEQKHAKTDWNHFRRVDLELLVVESVFYEGDFLRSTESKE